jgi:hypothetical protein
MLIKQSKFANFIYFIVILICVQYRRNMLLSESMSTRRRVNVCFCWNCSHWFSISCNMKDLHLIELNVLTIYCLCTKMKCFKIKERMSIELFFVSLLRLQKIESTYNVNWRFYSRLRKASWQQKNLKRESHVLCHNTNWLFVEIVYIDLTIHVEWKIHSRSKKTFDLEKEMSTHRYHFVNRVTLFDVKSLLKLLFSI